MTWADFYLICFVVGFAFSLLSFLAGGLRWHLHIPHLPHGLGHIGAGHVAHGPVIGGHGPVAAGTAHPTTGVSHGAAHAAHPGQISPFNFVTFTAFLAWFGGTGYLLTHYSSLWFLIGLGIALMSGFLGAGIIFLFLTKVLMSREETMDPADYEMVGVLAKVCSSIRAGGTGEIIFSLAGTRRTCGARSEDGSAMTKGSEVIVTRYEKGIAYVRLWEEMAGDELTGEARTSAEATGHTEKS